jgi:hypothetical protein
MAREVNCFEVLTLCLQCYYILIFTEEKYIITFALKCKRAVATKIFLHKRNKWFFSFIFIVELFLTVR